MDRPAGTRGIGTYFAVFSSEPTHPRRMPFWRCTFDTGWTLAARLSRQVASRIHSPVEVPSPSCHSRPALRAYRPTGYAGRPSALEQQKSRRTSLAGARRIRTRPLVSAQVGLEPSHFTYSASPHTGDFVTRIVSGTCPAESEFSRGGPILSKVLPPGHRACWLGGFRSSRRSPPPLSQRLHLYQLRWHGSAARGQGKSRLSRPAGTRGIGT